VTGYLVSHGDVAKLTHVLQNLLTNDRLRTEMGRRGQEKVHSSYLFEHFERRLTHVLEEVCPV